MIRRLGVLMIFVGLAMFVYPLLGQELSFMRWTSVVEHWGPMVGNIIKTFVVMLGFVLSMSAKH